VSEDKHVLKKPLVEEDSTITSLTVESDSGKQHRFYNREKSEEKGQHRGMLVFKNVETTEVEE